MPKPKFPNGLDQAVPEALRYLATHDRPSGGEQRFNAIHLYQLADEIEGFLKGLEKPQAQGPSPEVVALRAELAIQRSLTEVARRRASELGEHLEVLVKNKTIERGIKANAFDNLARCIRDPGQCRKQGLTDLEGVLRWHERHLAQVADALDPAEALSAWIAQQEEESKADA